MLTNSVITRNTIWLYSGDNPSIDLEIKGISTFTNFTKSLTYYVASGKKGVWPEGEERAREDGINLSQPKWFWFIEIDDLVTIGCGLNMGTELSIEFESKSPTATNFSLRITKEEGRLIREAVDDMIRRAVSDSRVNWKSEKNTLYQPLNSMIKYPVKSITLDIKEMRRRFDSQ